MKPFERFKKLNTEGNLWVYIMSTAKEKEICEDGIQRLIFEKFGFLPGSFLTRRVLYRLKREGYLSSERYKGKPAVLATEKGKEELEKMKNFSQKLIEELLEKI